MHEKVFILDFGSQTCQLIARRVRELNVFCEIIPHDTPVSDADVENLKGMIFSGGPASVLEDDAPGIDIAWLKMGLPILGICYGMQLITKVLGGQVKRHQQGREYGPAVLEVDNPDELFAGLDRRLDVWMSHGDLVEVPPAGFEILAHTDDCRVAAIGNVEAKLFGVQFHPEVVHTPKGKDILANFLFRIAGCKGDWLMSDFINEQVSSIRERVGKDKVICGLSGGVDSSVTAAIINRAVGNQMYAVFVDNGLLRTGEVEQIREFFSKDYPLNLTIVDARREFLDALKGLTDPEQKRKAIGKTFIDIFRREAKKIGNVKYLAQGTLYPDVIESRSARGGPSVTIKSHHNVGGLPGELEFELIEPLRELFKDEVRQLGKELGLPEKLLNRQPFPGPGLAVRIIGEVNEQRLDILRQADAIVREEMENWPGYEGIWQSFAVLLPVKSVGVMGDERTYANTVVVRAVTSTDGMTADWARLPHDLLARISSRIINEVVGINRVVYDISSKPPSTIEWE